MVESCGQVDSVGALNATVTAVPAQRPPSPGGPTGRDAGEDRVAGQIGFRRALQVGGAMWASFCIIDLAVVRYLDAGSLFYFLGLRLAVLAVIVGSIVRLYRSPAPSLRLVTAMDLFTYTAAATGVALMCVEFRGLASPYLPGMCLVLLSRTVTKQDPWRRGLAMTGIPVSSFSSS